jgi:hypothetical protein
MTNVDFDIDLDLEDRYFISTISVSYCDRYGNDKHYFEYSYEVMTTRTYNEFLDMKYKSTTLKLFDEEIDVKFSNEYKSPDDDWWIEEITKKEEIDAFLIMEKYLYDHHRILNCIYP